MIETIPTDSIYLDHAATTPVDPEVVSRMTPFFTEVFGNPSSIYQSGQDARAALDNARASVARSLGASPSEILFTSGSTESSNLAILGSVLATNTADTSSCPHIITSAIEHHAVLDTVEWATRFGATVTVVPCDGQGLVDPTEIKNAITSNTCLITVMYGNNEVGSIQPVDEIAAIANEADIPFHTDATQAAGLVPIDLRALPVAMMSLSAHKFYGPKGIGMLYVRNGTPIEFTQHGGGQESGRRAGTENVPLVVGMALALEKAVGHLPEYRAACETFREQLWSSLQESPGDLALNGPELGSNRLSNNLNFSVAGVQGETMLLSLDMLGIEVSAGSACTTGNTTASHVLTAMGLSDIAARSSLRVSMGRCNAPDQLEEIVDGFTESASRIRQLASV